MDHFSTTHQKSSYSHLQSHVTQTRQQIGHDWTRQWELSGQKLCTEKSMYLFPACPSQAWNFIFERARPFSFCKGHFHWKILSQWETFEGAPRPRPGATEAMASVACVKFHAYNHNKHNTGAIMLQVFLCITDMNQFVSLSCSSS